MLQRNSQRKCWMKMMKGNFQRHPPQTRQKSEYFFGTLLEDSLCLVTIRSLNLTFLFDVVYSSLRIGWFDFYIFELWGSGSKILSRLWGHSNNGIWRVFNNNKMKIFRRPFSSLKQFMNDSFTPEKLIFVKISLVVCQDEKWNLIFFLGWNIN